MTPHFSQSSVPIQNGRKFPYLRLPGIEDIKRTDSRFNWPVDNAVIFFGSKRDDLGIKPIDKKIELRAKGA
jgi:signal peptidase I